MGKLSTFCFGREHASGNILVKTVILVLVFSSPRLEGGVFGFVKKTKAAFVNVMVLKLLGKVRKVFLNFERMFSGELSHRGRDERWRRPKKNGQVEIEENAAMITEEAFAEG